MTSDRYLVHTPFTVRGDTIQPGTVLMLPDNTAARLAGYVTKIADTDFECYCGHTEFTQGLHGLRVCARCQVPETSIIKRRNRLGENWNK